MHIKRGLNRTMGKVKLAVFSFLDSHPATYRLDTGFGYLLRNAVAEYENAAWQDVAKNEMPTMYVSLPNNHQAIDTMSVVEHLSKYGPEDVAGELSRDEKLEAANYFNARKDQERSNFLRHHPRIRRILDDTVAAAKIKEYKSSQTADLMHMIGLLGSTVDRKKRMNSLSFDRRLYEILYEQDMRDLNEGLDTFGKSAQTRLHAVEVVGQIFKDPDYVAKVAEDVGAFEPKERKL